MFIPSCDKYHDLWKPFFTLFFKYWKDCPFPIYLCSNKIKYPDSRVKTILVGQDLSWASNCKKCLEKINTKYIILLQEDFLLLKDVNTQKIIELATYMEKREAACMRLYPSPPPNKTLADNREIGEIVKGADYRVSLQAAIWNKNIFYTLLENGESPWDFESYGSIRSNLLDAPFLSIIDLPKSLRPIDYFSTAVVQGQWIRQAVKICEKERILIDRRKRKVESKLNQIKREVTTPMIGKCKKILARFLRDDYNKDLKVFNDYEFLAKNASIYDNGSIRHSFTRGLVRELEVKSALDVGGGTNSYVSLLNDQYDTAIIDISLISLKYAKSKLKIQGALPYLPFPDGQFELVSALEVIEHLDSSIYYKSLAEIARASYKYIFITAPFLQDLSGAYVVCKKCKTVFQCEGHYRSFNFKDIEELQAFSGGG